MNAHLRAGSSILEPVVLDVMGHGGGRDVLPMVVDVDPWRKGEGAKINAGNRRVAKQFDQGGLGGFRAAG